MNALHIKLFIKWSIISEVIKGHIRTRSSCYLKIRCFLYILFLKNLILSIFIRRWSLTLLQLWLTFLWTTFVIAFYTLYILFKIVGFFKSVRLDQKLLWKHATLKTCIVFLCTSVGFFCKVLFGWVWPSSFPLLKCLQSSFAIVYIWKNALK